MNQLLFFGFLCSLLMGIGQCTQQGDHATYWTAEDDDKDEDLRNLTDNYTNLPSTYAVSEYLDSRLSAPFNVCLHAGAEGNDTYHNTPNMGARRMLATYFQSCKAIDNVITSEVSALEGVTSGTTLDGRTNPRGGRLRRITNSTQLVQSHIVLRELAADPNYPQANCRDMTLSPPVYGYGSRLRRASGNNGRINLFTSGDGIITPPPAVGSDCSTFISAALSASGLRIRKGGPAFLDLTTSDFKTMSGRSDSCIKPAEFDAETSLRPGDMINVSASHIIMIDTVSEDPLAIKRHAQSNTCNQLQVSDFDFTYIHSGSIRNSYGPSRVHISAHNGGSMFNNLRLSAVTMCQRMVAGRNGSVGARTLNDSNRFDILRHQSSDPACLLNERVKLEGEECVDQCF